MNDMIIKSIKHPTKLRQVLYFMNAPSLHQHFLMRKWFASAESCSDNESNPHTQQHECISTIEFLFLDLVKFLSLFNQVVENVS